MFGASNSSNSSRTVVDSAFECSPVEMLYFTEFTEATNARVDIDGISRHRLSPFNAHYLTSHSNDLLFPVPVPLLYIF